MHNIWVKYIEQVLIIALDIKQEDQKSVKNSSIKIKSFQSKNTIQSESTFIKYIFYYLF